MAVRTRSISTCTMVAFGIGRERLEACNQLDQMHGVRRCDAGDQFDGSHRHLRQDFIPRGRVRRQGAAFRAAAQRVVDETFPPPAVSLRSKDERDAPRPQHSRGWDVKLFQKGFVVVKQEIGFFRAQRHGSYAFCASIIAYSH